VQIQGIFLISIVFTHIHDSFLPNSLREKLGGVISWWHTSFNTLCI